MYANNLFTLNNVPTLSVGGRFSAASAMPSTSQEIAETDRVFVTVVQFGRTVMEHSFTGFSSLQALISVVKNSLGHVSGLVSVNVRNSTRGWASRRTLRLNGPLMSMLATA